MRNFFYHLRGGKKLYSARTSAKSTSLFLTTVQRLKRFTECLINVTFNAHNVINDTIFSSFSLQSLSFSLSLPAPSSTKLDDDCVALDGGKRVTRSRRMKARRKQKKRLQESWKSIESWTCLKSNVYKCFAASFPLILSIFFSFSSSVCKLHWTCSIWIKKKRICKPKSLAQTISIWYLLCLLPFSLC